MPIDQGYVYRDGEKKGYYQWANGSKYTYPVGNEKARKAAKTKAEKQRQAAYASGYDG